MKNIIILMILLITLSFIALAQFKTQSEKPSVVQSMIRPVTSANNFLGFLNSNSFMMKHNFSLNYMSFGGTSLSLASYTNSIFYRISEPLDVRFDVTLQGSPFGNSTYQNSLNGIYLSRAQLNYKPWENFLIKFEYNQLPMGFYGLSNPWYNPYSYPYIQEGE